MKKQKAEILASMIAGFFFGGPVIVLGLVLIKEILTPTSNAFATFAAFMVCFTCLYAFYRLLAYVLTDDKETEQDAVKKSLPLDRRLETRAEHVKRIKEEWANEKSYKLPKLR